MSEYATLRGKRSAAYPEDIYRVWVRDEYITFPNLPQDPAKVAVLLTEKDEAVEAWNQIVQLAEQLKMPDASREEMVEVTCRYGLQLYRIYRSLFYLAAIRQGLIEADKTSYIAEYDDAWAKWEELATTQPAYCPSLYSKHTIRRVRGEVADDVVRSMR